MTPDERDGTPEERDGPGAGGEATDEELLARAGRDASAFEPLVRRHSDALHGYFARRAPGAADDLLAEAWLQAYSTRHGFDADRGPARAWLFGVARNVLSAHWRRTERQRTGPRGEGRDDPWEAVDARLDAAAVAPRLRALLAELPSVERELLLLVAWEQLTPGEAAAAVGIPAGTARSRLHRARNRLRADTPLKLTGDLA
ncbi:RNA polymerase sigma factor [Streptomyces alboniger]|uniref:RNA polymerase sigma factor n=1 Tax=Streptomyces alboniger TaxID=132473 RepID=A0A5J6HNZ7_STRAD|nr:RNA polymerase sigma factor [Streptomyces alboniger]QEV20010.1 RNA polymerase sigma factor [Streptomyces alboniger]